LCFQNGVDLRNEIRGNADDEQICNLIKKAINLKPREHMFEQFNDNREVKLMSQIGG
jgi:molybdenum cofactor biosynthesis enzyme MoaA